MSKQNDTYVKGHADFTNKYTSDSSIGNQSSHRYDDIINLPHHASASHPRMSLNDRAAQFAPFAALRGLDETVRQQEILYEPRKILSEEKQNELDMKLNILTCDRKIQVTYFVRSQKNPLIGQYHTIMGTVKFFDSSSYLRIDDITPLLLRDSSSQ